MESFKAGKGPTGGSSGRQHRAVATPTDGSFSGELLVVVFVLTIGWAYMRGWFSDGAGSSRAATRTDGETSLQRWKPKPREPFKTLQEVEAAIRQQVGPSQTHSLPYTTTLNPHPKHPRHPGR